MSEFGFLDFSPVPVKPRHDGWLPAVQFEFVVLLAPGFSIEEAARSVGKSRTTAYALRKRSGSAGFAAAWNAALAYARRMGIARRAETPPQPVPVSRSEAAAVLDRLYPGWRGEAGKADEAERA